jgi:hypothetical protein
MPALLTRATTCRRGGMQAAQHASQWQLLQHHISATSQVAPAQQRHHRWPQHNSDITGGPCTTAQHSHVYRHRSLPIPIPICILTSCSTRAVLRPQQVPPQELHCLDHAAAEPAAECAATPACSLQPSATRAAGSALVCGSNARSVRCKPCSCATTAATPSPRVRTLLYTC